MKKVLAVVMVCLCLVCLFGCEKSVQKEVTNALVGCWVHEDDEGQVVDVRRFYKNGFVTVYQYNSHSSRPITENGYKYYVEDNLLVLISGADDYDTITYEISLSKDTLQMTSINHSNSRETKIYRYSEENIFDMLIPQNKIPQK